jgi:hypothetical protein
MNQQSMFSPLLNGLTELKRDEGGQIMPFTAVLSLFLIVIWLTVYNVGVGVIDKIRLQDMADQMAYSQAIVGARSLNLIALTNRTMVANLVSYTTTVIMRSHSKFIKDLTTILNLIFTIISLIPPVAWVKFIGAAFDAIGAAYDVVTYGLAFIWRPVLQLQTVFVLLPASKLMYSALAALPALNAAEYQGMAIYQELTNEELDSTTGAPLWTKFGARHLGVDIFSGSLSVSGVIMDAIAAYLQVVSWASFDHLLAAPEAGENTLDFLHAIIPGSSATKHNVDKSAFSLLNFTAQVSQRRRLSWMVEQTHPRVEAEGSERWGFNRSPLPDFFGTFFSVTYFAIANAYTLFVHGSPARVSTGFDGETRVDKYTEGGRIHQPGQPHPRRARYDMIPYLAIGGGTREAIWGGYPKKDTSQQFEIVAYDYFEVEVEYIDWDPWPSWEREDTLSFEIGEAGFSSSLEMPVFEFLEKNVIKSLGGIAIESFYKSLPTTGFNDSSPYWWRGIFHEKNPSYDNFFIGIPSQVSGALGQFTGIIFSPVGYMEIDQAHYANKHRNMFDQRYVYHRQESKAGTATPSADRIEQRKGKYYVVLGKDNTQMRLHRWLGLLDGGGTYTANIGIDHNSHFDGSTISNGAGAGDSGGNYNKAAEVTATTEIDPHFRIPSASEGYMAVISKSEVFYERPHLSGDPQARRNELPNLFNPFWSARLSPIGPDIDAAFTSVLGPRFGGTIGGIFSNVLFTH